jgi:hypothetical protein
MVFNQLYRRDRLGDRGQLPHAAKKNSKKEEDLRGAKPSARQLNLLRMTGRLAVRRRNPRNCVGSKCAMGIP